jgi:hypothetical protein|tara:strand:- start:458 stop:631 length:174 start_codon:yes stop_codon:yes gene_type:complete
LDHRVSADHGGDDRIRAFVSGAQINMNDKPVHLRAKDTSKISVFYRGERMILHPAFA